jgi:hypothetical protein
MVSLGGGHLLGDGLVGVVVARSFEVLPVQGGEVDAVGLVSDQQVEHGPDQSQAAGLAGEAAHHLRAAFDLAERPLEQIRAAPSPAVTDRVSQVHHEPVEVIGEAAGGGRLPRSPWKFGDDGPGVIVTQ